jgi:peptide/nickel transport system substrate-binding protein
MPVLVKAGLVRLVVILSIVTLVGVGCPDGGAETRGGDTPGQDASEVKEGGTLVFGADQELTGFNFNTSKHAQTSVAMVVRNLWPAAYRVRPNFTVEPYVLDGPARVLSTNPFSVEWKIKGDADWDDGTPVSADDFEYVFETCNGKQKDADCASITGYDQITEFQKVDPKTVRATFVPAFGEYESLFGWLPPAHIAKQRGGGVKAWNEGFDSDPGASSGPYKLERWDRGSSLVLVRNDKWWGPKPHLEKIVYRFLPESSAQPNALRNSEVDMIYPQPQLDQVNVVKGFTGVRSRISFGPSFEFLTFNSKHPFLAVPEVRQAIALAVDRAAIVDTLMKPFSEKASRLDNRVLVANQKGYQAHGQDYAKAELGKATSLLEKAGFTKGPSGFYEKDGTPLRLRLSTTAGNKLREQQGVLIQAQLRKAGIDIRIDNAPSATFFGRVADGNFDIANYALRGSPFAASNVDSTYRTGGGYNDAGYSNPEVDGLMTMALREPDFDKRTALLNQVDELLWKDLPNLPLYQKPTFLAYEARYANIADNTTYETPFWNVEEWGIRASRE